MVEKKLQAEGQEKWSEEYKEKLTQKTYETTGIKGHTPASLAVQRAQQAFHAKMDLLVLKSLFECKVFPQLGGLGGLGWGVGRVGWPLNKNK